MAIRIAIVWAVLRAASSAYGASIGLEVTPPLATALPGIAWTWGAVVLALRIDLGRRQELLVLANLGQSFRSIAVLAIAQCIALETLVRVLT